MCIPKEALDPILVPLLNCCILLSSGVRVTWAHHALILQEQKSSERGLIMTLLLAVAFTSAQAFEY